MTPGPMSSASSASTASTSPLMLPISAANSPVLRPSPRSMPASPHMSPTLCPTTPAMTEKRRRKAYRPQGLVELPLTAFEALASENRAIFSAVEQITFGSMVIWSHGGYNTDPDRAVLNDFLSALRFDQDTLFGQPLFSWWELRGGLPPLPEDTWVRVLSYSHIREVAAFRIASGHLLADRGWVIVAQRSFRNPCAGPRSFDRWCRNASETWPVLAAFEAVDDTVRGLRSLSWPRVQMADPPLHSLRAARPSVDLLRPTTPVAQALWAEGTLLTLGQASPEVRLWRLGASCGARRGARRWPAAACSSRARAAACSAWTCTTTGPPAPCCPTPSSISQRSPPPASSPLRRNLACASWIARTGRAFALSGKPSR